MYMNRLVFIFSLIVSVFSFALCPEGAELYPSSNGDEQCNVINGQTITCPPGSVPDYYSSGPNSTGVECISTAPSNPSSNNPAVFESSSNLNKFNSFFKSPINSLNIQREKDFNEAYLKSLNYKSNSPTISFEETSKADKCEFNLIKDDWSIKTDALKLTQMIMLGFETANLAATDSKYTKDDIKGELSQMSLNDEIRAIAVQFKALRAEKINNADKGNKYLTCKCVAAFGGEDANLSPEKIDYFKSNCPDEVASVKKIKEDQGGTFSDSSGKFRAQLLDDFVRIKRIFENDSQNKYDNVHTMLKDLNYRIENRAWQETVVETLNLPTGHGGEQMTFEEGYRYTQISQFKLRDGKFFGMFGSGKELHKKHDHLYRKKKNWFRNLNYIIRYYKTPWTNSCYNYQVPSGSNGTSPYSSDQDDVSGLWRSSCPNGNCSTGLPAHAGRCIKQAYIQKSFNPNSTYKKYLLDPMILTGSMGSGTTNHNIQKALADRATCRFNAAKAHLSQSGDSFTDLIGNSAQQLQISLDMPELGVVGDIVNTGTGILGYTGSLYQGVGSDKPELRIDPFYFYDLEYFFPGKKDQLDNSVCESEDLVAAARAKSLSLTDENKIKDVIKDYLVENSVFKNGSELKKMTDYVYDYHYTFPKLSASNMISYPTPGVFFYYKMMANVVKSALLEMEVTDNARNPQLGGGGYGDFGTEMENGGNVYNEVKNADVKYKNSGIKLDIKNASLSSAGSDSLTSDVSKNSDNSFFNYSAARTSGLSAAVTKIKERNKIEEGRKLSALKGSDLKKYKETFRRSQNARTKGKPFLSKASSGNSANNSAISKNTLDKKDNDKKQNTITGFKRKDTGSSSKSGFSLSSSLSSSEDSYHTNGANSNQYLLESVDRVRNQLSSNEDDTIFQKVTKAYLRNAELVLSKKKSKTKRKKVDPKKKKDLEHFFN